MQHQNAFGLWISRLTLTQRRQQQCDGQRSGEGPRAKRSTWYGSLPEAHRPPVPRLTSKAQPNYQID